MLVLRPMSRILLTALIALVATLLPAVIRAEPHVVRKGESLGLLAKRFGCSIAELKAANGLRSDKIRIGAKLDLPESCEKADAKDAKADASAPKDAKAKKPQRITHEVLDGETLEEIALRYGMPLEALREKNRNALKKGLKPGLKLKVETTASERAQRKLTYTIEAGDTLGSIGKRFGVTVKDLMRMNPKKHPDKLRIGDRLVIYKEGKASRSEAVGLPQRGRLVNGEQMTNIPGAYVRRPDNAWGTNETIRALKVAIAEVRRKHPQSHDLVIGDISRKEGGFLSPHRSHQSGLDVDVGFYFSGLKREGPKVALDALKMRLDYGATWAFINALAGPNEASSSVEYMFIGYNVQEKLYQWAKENGVSEARLDWIFQYPRGSRAMRGLIRHEPGHTNHIHIRFQCPRGDSACL
jgi:LysM repeat protein